MLSSKRATLRVQTVGLVSSTLAVAAIGLTLLADNRNLGFGGSVTRSEQVALLFVAVGVCLVHLFLRLTHRLCCKRSDRDVGR
jgi:hypothetical protein